MEKVAVFRKEHFNAAHRLHNPNWDNATNEKIFGKCNLPHYHGHNYELIVRVTGVPDSETGYVIDMKILSDLIQENVVNKFDHRNLNLDVPEFKALNPTAENIAIIIYQLLRPLIEIKFDVQITLYETPRNYVTYPAN